MKIKETNMRIENKDSQKMKDHLAAFKVILFLKYLQTLIRVEDYIGNY